MASPLFRLRDRVRIKSDPARRGRILDQKEMGSSFDYFVTFGEDEAWFRERSLELVPDNHLQWRTRDNFLRDLLIAKLRYPLTDSLYAYKASRTIFEPYQFKPALKFLKNPDQRLLIADEVGLGKTIEAAIIYLELKARLNISRVLVLCPSRLRKKWQDELLNRFEEDFGLLEASGVRNLIENYARIGNQAAFRAIVSYETMRRPEFITAFVENQLPIDLLIVDEAHYMRNSETATHQIGETLADLADAVVFLTATPLHLGNHDLYNLLNMLSPGDFNDARLFEEQVRPNQYINAAAQLLAAGNWSGARDELRRVEATIMRNRFVGNPFYQDVLSGLSREQPAMRDRIRLQRQLLDLNTLATIFTRTRKREVTNAAVRAAHTIVVDLSTEEKRFYDGVLRHVREELRRSGHGAPGFANMVRERMAASCLIATRELFEESNRLHRETLGGVERSPYDLGELDEDGDVEVSSVDTLLGLSRRIGTRDTKFDLFEQTLRNALAEDQSSKALVFSTYRRTLEYLLRRLREKGYTVDVIHGGVDIPSRQKVIEQFRDDKQFRVLLSSEVGAEGLDFQFADILMNYDLPWNPMQVEQRIGRLDRFGQEHERIRIYNFYIEDTIESRIFQRLYERIDVFRQSIGDLEVILGEEIKSLSKQVLQANLTPEEESAAAEAAALRIIRRQHEAEELERHKDELLGQERIFNQQVVDTVDSGRVVHAEEVRALVETFIKKRFPSVEMTRDSEEPCWTLTVTPELSTYLSYAKDTAGSQMGSRFKQALGHYRQVALTFESDYARQRPYLEFVTWQHLLARAAVAFWRAELASDTGIPSFMTTVYGPKEETGTGYFFIFAMDQDGAARKRSLEPVVVLDSGVLAQEVAKRLLGQFHSASGPPNELEHDEAQFVRAEERARAWIARKRDRSEADAHRRNEALIRARSASINASFDAKISRTKQLLLETTDPRIQRLRKGELRNLEAKRQAKLGELKHASSVTTSYSLVAMGRIAIREQADQVPKIAPEDASRSDDSKAELPALRQREPIADAFPETFERKNLVERLRTAWTTRQENPNKRRSP